METIQNLTHPSEKFICGSSHSDQQTQQTQQISNALFENAIEVNLTIGRWTASCNDERITQEIIRNHSATHDAGKFNKQLLPKQVIEPIVRLEGQIRRLHHSFTLPWRESSRLLAADLYLDYTQQMSKLKDDFYKAVDKLVMAYPSLIEERKLALNGMFNADDYPSQAELARKHYIRITFEPATEFEAFKRLRLSQGVISSLVKEAAQLQQRRIHQAQYDLWQRLKEQITALVNNTEPDAKFTKSTFENLERLVDIISTYSKVFDSPELDRMQQEVRQVIVDRYQAQEMQKKFNGNHALAVRQEVNQCSKKLLSELETKIQALFG